MPPLDLVKGLHEPYQALLSASMGNGTINFAAKSTRLASLQNGQIDYLLTFFLLSFFLSFFRVLKPR